MGLLPHLLIESQTGSMIAGLLLGCLSAMSIRSLGFFAFLVNGVRCVDVLLFIALTELDFQFNGGYSGCQ